MSATGEGLDIAYALKVTCGLPGCNAQPGKPCVNSVNGELRDEPHRNRVVRGYREPIEEGHR